MLSQYLDLPWWIRGPIAVGVLSLGLWLTIGAQREQAKFTDESKNEAVALPTRDNATPF